VGASHTVPRVGNVDVVAVVVCEAALHSIHREVVKCVRRRASLLGLSAATTAGMCAAAAACCCCGCVCVCCLVSVV
jgi:hypothetical protein